MLAYIFKSYDIKTELNSELYKIFCDGIETTPRLDLNTEFSISNSNIKGLIQVWKLPHVN